MCGFEAQTADSQCGLLLLVNPARLGLSDFHLIVEDRRNVVWFGAVRVGLRLPSSISFSLPQKMRL